jgi:hypothetical protein
VQITEYKDTVAKKASGTLGSTGGILYSEELQSIVHVNICSSDFSLARDVGILYSPSSLITQTSHKAF